MKTSVRELSSLLKLGSTGAEVITLQTKLRDKFNSMASLRNVNPGEIDGIFGTNTKKAVIAFQTSVGLIPDGIVGQNTWAALNTSNKHTVDTGLFTVDAVSQMFDDAPRRNIEKYLPTVLKALEKLELGDRDMILMALSTIRAETASFAPISEFQSRHNTTPDKHAFNRYDFRADLGNGAVGDGAKYRGRGFIQLTGKANYRIYSQRLGMGDRLLIDPELANEPEIAADILAYFLKDKEYLIRQDLASLDLKAARRRVNGGSHGLERFTTAFHRGRAFAINAIA